MAKAPYWYNTKIASKVHVGDVIKLMNEDDSYDWWHVTAVFELTDGVNIKAKKLFQNKLTNTDVDFTIPAHQEFTYRVTMK